MKICTKCLVEKEESEFHKNKNKKDGLHIWCKECKKQYNKEYNAKPEIKEKRKQHNEQWRSILENKQYQKDWRHRSENKEKLKQYQKKYEAKPGIKEKKKQHRTLPEIKKRKNQLEKEKRLLDPCFKLKKNISRAICKYFKNSGGSKQGSSILSKLPYTMQELKIHIESLWEPWMNWGNHGSYDPNKRTWRIDHIRPHSSFRYDNMDCQEFKDCWVLSNLKPLEAMENIKKGIKI